MISDQEFFAAAGILGCEVAAIRAVDTVESGGAGFMASGKIKIKFEGHKFREFTKGIYDKEHPTLSYRSFTDRYAVYGEGSYDRFNQAFRLDPEAAMKATSWGRYQVMGYHYSTCGFKNIHEFITYLKLDESNHLEVFCKFLKVQGLVKYIAGKRWAQFALRYNGSQYKKNLYDVLLEEHYEAWVKRLAKSKIDTTKTPIK